MTNIEWIKSMDSQRLAEFINIPIGCNDICKDHNYGCAWNCKHNQGVDIIKEWLEQDVKYILED